jgi:feruloyl esterase
MEAERYPSDFDGILMGAPALDWSSVHDAMLWETRQTAADQSHFIPKEKLAIVKAAVINACDASDGLKDGLIQNPLRCHFDPAAIQCKAGDGADCLTSGQVDALRKLYQGPTSSSGDRLYYGAVPGSEEELWSNLGPVTADNIFVNLSISTFEAINGVNGAQTFDWQTFDFADQMRKSKANVGAIVDATDTDIRAFLLRGKLLAYTGWNDPFVKPERVIAYYKAVEDLVGQRKAAESIRLFMVPNMGHCVGGDGPNDFGQFAPAAANSPVDPEHNALMALETWVERGKAPDQVVATHYQKSGDTFKASISRPLCPYPQVARFNGSGDVNDAKNFKCVTERPATDGRTQ